MSQDVGAAEADGAGVSGGGVTVRVTSAELAADRDKVLPDLAAVAGKLADKDPTLWGHEAEPEASIRLGWVDLAATSRDLLPRLAKLSAELQREGLDRVVLAGMGGSSLAPEVITRTAGVELTVLDTTDPHQVRAALADRLDRTVVVVSSKSGGTVETDSHRRAFAQAFADLGLTPEQVGRRFVAVTDPGSGLAEIAAAQGFREVFLADSTVGGRYSALTAFGLVPSALAGVEVSQLLDDAGRVREALEGTSGNPGLELGALLGGGGMAGRDKVVLVDSEFAGFGDWAEQLIAESTGKQGRGLLPVAAEGADAPGTRSADVQLARLGDGADVEGTVVTGPLGAQFLVWEYAVALAGRALGINPFDQPNVAESKENTQQILAAGLPDTTPAFTDGAVEVYGDVKGASTVAGALDALLAAIPDRGYLAVMAYLDRFAEAEAAELRRLLAARTDRAVTFGWGPRFLHSTGQYHKGGPQVGTYLQVTGAVTEDLAVPGRDYSFGTLQAAQAAGDLKALAGRGRPVVRLHLTDRADGLAQVLAAAREGNG
ncbi:MAG: glucose-6-phosphate isomerase [Mycobacteriales bacterium]